MRGCGATDVACSRSTPSADVESPATKHAFCAGESEIRRVSHSLSRGREGESYAYSYKSSKAISRVSKQRCPVCVSGNLPVPHRFQRMICISKVASTRVQTEDAVS